MIQQPYPPLSPLETALKRFLLRRPDMQKQIPSSTEFAEYMAWMAEEYNRPRNFAGLDIAETALSDSARAALAEYGQGAAVRRFEQKLDRHNESDLIPAGRDISADLMTRYLPSHWHTSGFFEVYYAVQGECPIHFRDETVTLHPGSLMIVTPSVVHASPCFADDRVLAYFLIRSSTFNEVFWNQLEDDSLLTSFFRQALGGKLTTSYLQFDTENDAEIRDFLRKIYAECHGSERYAAKVSNALMNVVFSLLLRRYEGTARMPRTEDFYWRQEFSAILSYLQTHFAAATIEDVAAHFHYSRRQINRIVQSCMGMSYKEVIHRLRMERAQVLLREGTLTLEEIARKMGYASAPSFHRAFTRYYGFTPGELSARGKK